MVTTAPSADDLTDTDGILALAFDSPLRAQQAVLSVLRLDELGLASLEDAVILRRRGRGHAHVTGRSDPLTPAAAVSSSLIGAVVGTLVAGPLGMLVGGVLAGGTGALASRHWTAHIPHRLLVQLSARALPGETVLVLRLRGSAEALAAELRGFPGVRLVHAELPPSALAHVRDALYVA